MNKIVSISVVLIAIVTGTECAKILGIFYVPGPSHYMAGNTLMRILASKGHDVTMVAPYKDKNPPKNFNEVVLTGLVEELSSMKVNLFEQSMNPWIRLKFFHHITFDMLKSAFEHPEFQKLLTSQEKFDAVIVEQFQSEIMKYVAYHFKVPLIIFTAMDANDYVHIYQGNPDSPAYVPSLHIPEITCEMNFFERVKNSLFYVSQHVYRHFVILPDHDALLHKHFPDAPPLEQIAYNVSLALVNADASVQESLPKVPSMINIGGFHINPPKRLPDDLQKILDNAKNGVIYFSLGSNLKSKEMPEEKRKIFLNTFAKLKETILWKFEDENLPEKSNNVIIREWFPQNDILAHKNIKLFITHGGIFSSMESIYNGIPILALPVFGDQNSNSQRAEAQGYAKHIPFVKLEEEEFFSTLKELLDNPKYKKNAEKRSTIMKDKPMSPADSVNYWVEYVIRHDGAPHLRVASLKLSWYQAILLDVILFLAAVVFVICFTVRLIFKAIRCKKNNKKEKVQ